MVFDNLNNDFTAASAHHWLFCKFIQHISFLEFKEFLYNLIPGKWYFQSTVIRYIIHHTFSMLQFIEFIGCIAQFRVILVFNLIFLDHFFGWELSKSFKLYYTYWLYFFHFFLNLIFSQQFMVFFKVFMSYKISRSMCWD
ncbi:MAG: hypothetical protein A4E27_00247 [Methanobacterium sp. PtaU1.Bin242]|nr:MAG: hypothetical protein A4E27_00247 [Methanobacterium sp. PtaU1.Bin242]